MSSPRTSFSDSDSEPEPDSPVPFCRPWKHLENPAAKEWTRGPKEIHNYPNLGDFVVLSINPLASVAHLDAGAKQAARSIPRRKYVALALQTHGLPIPSKPTHPYDFLFVRKGKPQPRLPDIDTDNSCFAILPNDMPIPERPTVRPAQPLPWNDCYLDTTYGFPYPCRVTSTGRDYTPVLPMLDTEIIRIRNILQKLRFGLTDIRMEMGDKWPQPFDFIDLPALSDASVLQGEGMEPREAAQATGLTLEATTPVHPDADDASIIGSDDGSQSEAHEEPPPDGDGEEGLETFLAFESMMNDVGDLRDPVVDVWYDLDVVTEIVDPVHFLEDMKRLTIIMDEAEMRLGRHPDPIVEDNASDSEQSSLQEGHGGRHSVEHSSDLGTDPASTRTQPGTWVESSRPRLGSTTSKLFLRARTLLYKLGIVRFGKPPASRSKSGL
ncbi:unnamed protein product [Peniophora sp. CBMAI 1063]|nr:unnamed protein product [Peniophora sp. CBMAI 1063]